MAAGLGRMLGFKLPINFMHPYLSTSMTEFWRRWHITLGQWFQTYIYIPLGGNRTGTCKWIRNLLVVWILTGIWHGHRISFYSVGIFPVRHCIDRKTAVEKIDGPIRAGRTSLYGSSDPIVVDALWNQ